MKLKFALYCVNILFAGGDDVALQSFELVASY